MGAAALPVDALKQPAPVQWIALLLWTVELQKPAVHKSIAALPWIAVRSGAAEVLAVAAAVAAVAVAAANLEHADLVAAVVVNKLISVF
ncbi:MAG: hypothetical protein R3C11_17960 [Planctomycetaceae bacterium]